MRDQSVVESNPPTLHHYIPRFWLRAWTRDGMLYRYTEPRRGKVVEHRKPPSAVGSQSGLYEVVDVPPQQAQQVETHFFKALDNDAADAHRVLANGEISRLTASNRNAWTTFVLSLFLRGPDSLQAYKSGFKAVFDAPNPELQAKYESIKKPHDPPTVEGFMLRHDPNGGIKAAMSRLPSVIQNEMLGQFIINMTWNIIDVEVGQFLISDEPLIMTNGIGGGGGHIVTPITPRRLFVATNRAATFRAIEALGPKVIVREVNERIVGRARKFVASRDQSQARFIGNRFGGARERSISEAFYEQQSMRPGSLRI